MSKPSKTIKDLYIWNNLVLIISLHCVKGSAKATVIFNSNTIPVSFCSFWWLLNHKLCNQPLQVTKDDNFHRNMHSTSSLYVILFYITGRGLWCIARCRERDAGMGLHSLWLWWAQENHKRGRISFDKCNKCKCNASWEKFQLFKHICGLHPVNKIDWSICIEKQVRKNLGTSGTWTCIYCLPGSIRVSKLKKKKVVRYEIQRNTYIKRIKYDKGGRK